MVLIQVTINSPRIDHPYPSLSKVFNKHDKFILKDLFIGSVDPLFKNFHLLLCSLTFGGATLQKEWGKFFLAPFSPSQNISLVCSFKNLGNFKNC